jgi:hypothetical protein
MARMVRPGGILAFTYDFQLSYPYAAGWSPMADHEFLITLGLQPCFPRRPPANEAFIYNHSDTLFVQPDMILAYCDFLYRISILCFAFQKPGGSARVTYGPAAELHRVLHEGPFEYPMILPPEPSDSPERPRPRFGSVIQRFLPRIGG